jgi:hypothetical protein
LLSRAKQSERVARRSDNCFVVACRALAQIIRICAVALTP